MTWFLVGMAGMIGVLLRYGLGMAVWQLMPQTAFPAGTLAANLIGCFAPGSFAGWTAHGRLSPRIRTAVSTGLIGSFTTYSTFSVETLDLIRQGWWRGAAAYVAASVLGGLFLARLGAAAAGGGKADGGHG